MGHESSDDDVNIARAILALRQHLLPEDRGLISWIEGYIQDSRHPYLVPSEELELPSQILRDADMAQALDSVWIQQVIFGLAEEWKTSPLKILKKQIPFHEQLAFVTEWGKQKFPESVIKARIEESKSLLIILKGGE